jgi:tetratricopeptide repeat protein 21B
MATKQKADIEFALGRLMDALAKWDERVPILLAIATAQTLLNQTAKAKSQLQDINRLEYKWQSGEEFERAWLMLANIYIQVFSVV